MDQENSIKTGVQLFAKVVTRIVAIVTLSSNLAYLLKTISSSHNVFNCPLECILFLSFLMHTLLFGLSAAAYSGIIL